MISSKNRAFLFVMMLLLIGNLAKADTSEAITLNDPAKDYSFGKELLTKVLESIDRNDLETNIKLELEFNDKNEIKSLVGTTVILDFGFKQKLSEGFEVPFSYQSPSQSKEQKKMTSFLQIRGDSLRARVKLSATNSKGEFEGSIIFYTQKSGSNISTSVKIKVANSILVIAEYELFGAEMKIKIPLESKTDSSTIQSNDKIKKELSDGVIKCVANSNKPNPTTGKIKSAKLSECLFTFNSNGLKKIAIKDTIDDFKPIQP